VALVLVRLKLALLRAALRQAKIEGIVGTVFALLVALAVGGTGAAFFATVRFVDDPVATDVTIAAFTVVFFVWLLGPIITAASDGTLPPEQLAPFPLTGRQLMPGLTLATVVGFGGLCTALVLLGAFAGLAPFGALAVVTVLALVAQLLTCAVFSRLLATLVSGAVRRRRGRDLALVIGPLLGLVVNIALQVLLRETFDPNDPQNADFETWRAVRPFLVTLPSGTPAIAAGLAREGNAAGAVSALVVAWAVVALGLKLWHIALERSLTTAGGGSAERRRKPRALFPWFVRFLPRSRVGAVAARELRLTWRDPRQRAAFFGSIFAPVLLIFSIRTLSSVDPGIVLLGIAPGMFIAIGSANLWGYDGRAAWTDAVASGDRGDDVIGKVVARAILAAVMSAAGIAGLAVRVGSAARVGEAVALAASAFGLVTGVAVVLAVRSPYPMPDSRTNVFSSGTTGQGFGQAGIALGLLFGSTLVIAPVGAALAYVDSSTGRAFVSIGALVAGFAVLGAGVRSASEYLRSHGPEVLENLVPDG